MRACSHNGFDIFYTIKDPFIYGFPLFPRSCTPSQARTMVGMYSASATLAVSGSVFADDGGMVMLTYGLGFGGRLSFNRLVGHRHYSAKCI